MLSDSLILFTLHHIPCNGVCPFQITGYLLGNSNLNIPDSTPNSLEAKRNNRSQQSVLMTNLTLPGPPSRPKENTWHTMTCMRWINFRTNAAKRNPTNWKEFALGATRFTLPCPWKDAENHNYCNIYNTRLSAHSLEQKVTSKRVKWPSKFQNIHRISIN